MGSMDPPQFELNNQEDEDLEPASTAPTDPSGEQDDQGIVRVIDAPLHGQAPTLLLQTHSDDDFSEKFKSLPEHPKNTARIFDYNSEYWNPKYEKQKASFQAALAECIRRSCGLDLTIKYLVASLNALPSNPSTNDVSCIAKLWSQNSATSLGETWVGTKTTLSYTTKWAPQSIGSQLTTLRQGNDKLIGTMPHHNDRFLQD
jgi:hypothetical protein